VLIKSVPWNTNKFKFRHVVKLGFNGDMQINRSNQSVSQWSHWLWTVWQIFYSRQWKYALSFHHFRTSLRLSLLLKMTVGSIRARTKVCCHDPSFQLLMLLVMSDIQLQYWQMANRFISVTYIMNAAQHFLQITTETQINNKTEQYSYISSPELTQMIQSLLKKTPCF
jgi:hypothetical protein